MSTITHSIIACFFHTGNNFLSFRHRRLSRFRVMQFSSLTSGFNERLQKFFGYKFSLGEWKKTKLWNEFQWAINRRALKLLMKLHYDKMLMRLCASKFILDHNQKFSCSHNKALNKPTAPLYLDQLQRDEFENNSWRPFSLMRSTSSYNWWWCPNRRYTFSFIQVISV